VYADLVKPPDAREPHKAVKPSHRASVKAFSMRLPYPGTVTTYRQGRGRAHSPARKEMSQSTMVKREAEVDTGLSSRGRVRGLPGAELSESLLQDTINLLWGDPCR